MAEHFPYEVRNARIALELPDEYVWDCSVIKAQGKYHLFSSHWPKKYGFGANWLYHSEIIHCISDRPEGPYAFSDVVLPPRDRRYFDGMNTHNTCIKEFGGKFYLYYMGCTYGGQEPGQEDPMLWGQFYVETWNRKRIGLAVADSISGPFVRRETPLLEPRDCSHWDCTITSNPTVTILPDGTTYLIYKSRQAMGQPLQLGAAVADSPEGPFRRLQEGPILQFDNPDFHIEDPYLWYDATRKKFCLLAKDDLKHGCPGITGEWGSGFYAESDDCVHFVIDRDPKVYSRTVSWADGKQSTQCNLERCSLLFDETGAPTHLFCASGSGEVPYEFKEKTYIISMELKEKT